ncbi:lipocalin-like domain-containing protein [Chitiniphilus shinanonensis]|uniref:lipocalin-like domain-containing protein n=1 Tax=Chitiniphilus shinanonensis TaxID=553088 RepID=UPI003071FD02
MRVEGRWELLSSDLTIGDKTYPCGAGRYMVKEIRAGRFNFFSAAPQRAPFPPTGPTPEARLAAAESFDAGAGTYTLDGERYVESVEFCSYPNYVGADLAFTVRVDGDTLVQEGEYPLTRLGLGPVDGYLIETYRRIED